MGKMYSSCFHTSDARKDVCYQPLKDVWNLIPPLKTTQKTLLTIIATFNNIKESPAGRLILNGRTHCTWNWNITFKVLKCSWDKNNKVFKRSWVKAAGQVSVFSFLIWKLRSSLIIVLFYGGSQIRKPVITSYGWRGGSTYFLQDLYPFSEEWSK